MAVTYANIDTRGGGDVDIIAADDDGTRRLGLVRDRDRESGEALPRCDNDPLLSIVVPIYVVERGRANVEAMRNG